MHRHIQLQPCEMNNCAGWALECRPLHMPAVETHARRHLLSNTSAHQQRSKRMANETTTAAEQVPEKMKVAMASRGIRKSEYAKELSLALGISVPTAYKKLNGNTAMTLSQMECFGAHFGVQILMEEAPSQTEQEAIFKAGKTELPCIVELGALGLKDEYSKRYAAFSANGTWYVSEVANCPLGADLREVQNITLRQTRSIAVLDDDCGTADNHRDYLTAKGYKALAFYDSASTKAAIKVARFDGYFLDWRLADETSESLIKFIRELQPMVPVIVSTASGADGIEHQTVLAKVSTQYRVECYKKPMSMKALTSIMADAITKGGN